MGTFKESAELRYPVLILEGTATSNHEKARNFRSLSAQSEEFIRNAPTHARAETEEAASSEGTAWTTPATAMMVLMMSMSMAVTLWSPATLRIRTFTLHPGRSPSASPVDLLCL